MISVSGSTRVAAVIGDPVAHSLSPALHNAGFAALELDWILVALPVAAGRGAEAVAAMSALGLSGLAVTTPHKHTAAAAVDSVDPAAAALQSVNTVVRKADGSTFGASTDGVGFVDSLDSAGIRVDGLRVVVLGAGGAARSIIDAVGRRGPAEVTVINRTVDRAEAACELASMARLGTPAEIREADVIVNATTVGMGSNELALDPDLLRPGQVVADIVYHPRQTALLVAAERAGARAIDGLGMLVHQARRQQLLWTGACADAEVMTDAAERELLRRSSAPVGMLP